MSVSPQTTFAQHMRNFLTRIVFVVATGYIVYFYSEFMFWSRWRPEDTVPGQVWMVFVYSLLAYLFLWVVYTFRVRSVWALFLAAAIYGWTGEGAVAGTMFWGFYFISWTGLAWHALITVMVGWYLMKRFMRQDNLLHTAALATAIGLFWGVWGVFWWAEDVRAVPAPEFAASAAALGALLVPAYWISDRMRPESFRPTLAEGIFLLLLAGTFYTFGFAIPTPHTLLIFVPAMGLTFAGLWRNRRDEWRPNVLVELGARPRPAQYALLLLIPIVATLVYSLVALGGTDQRIPTNLVVFYVTTPLGALAYALSLLQVWRRYAETRSTAALPATEGLGPETYP